MLAKLDSEYPADGWGAYYEAASGTYPDSLPMPKWSMITFMGHSQGAGHSAYLAATKDVHGAVLVSGPQDECEGCPDGTKFWIDEPFKSTKTQLLLTEMHQRVSWNLLSQSWKIIGPEW